MRGKQDRNGAANTLELDAEALCTRFKALCTHFEARLRRAHSGNRARGRRQNQSAFRSGSQLAFVFLLADPKLQYLSLTYTKK